jgi:hypothetical protein
MICCFLVPALPVRVLNVASDYTYNTLLNVASDYTFNARAAQE